MVQITEAEHARFKAIEEAAKDMIAVRDDGKVADRLYRLQKALAGQTSESAGQYTIFQEKAEDKNALGAR